MPRDGSFLGDRRSRRVGMGFAALVLAALLTVGWWASTSREPVANGYPVTRWVQAFAGRPARRMEPDDLRNAVRGIEGLGPAAYPPMEAALLEPRPVARWLLGVWQAMPRALRNTLPAPLTAEAMRAAAFRIVEEWSPASRLAFTRYLLGRVDARMARASRDHRQVLVHVVDVLRPEAEALLPRLRTWMHWEDAELNRALVNLLLKYGPQAAPAVPELTAALSGTNREDLATTVQVLGKVGLAARSAVPALERLLGTGTTAEDAVVAQALWAIDRQTNTALRYLTNAIEDGSGNAAHTLGVLGAAGRPALPSLLAALESPVGNVRMNSARAAVGIDAALAPRAVAAVAQMLSTSLARRPRTPEADGTAWYAASVLREFGTNAASARAVLELGAKSMHPDTAAECRAALQTLEASGCR